MVFGSITKFEWNKFDEEDVLSTPWSPAKATYSWRWPLGNTSHHQIAWEFPLKRCRSGILIVCSYWDVATCDVRNFMYCGKVRCKRWKSTASLLWTAQDCNISSLTSRKAIELIWWGNPSCHYINIIFLMDALRAHDRLCFPFEPWSARHKWRWEFVLFHTIMTFVWIVPYVVKLALFISQLLFLLFVFAASPWVDLVFLGCTLQHRIAISSHVLQCSVQVVTFLPHSLMALCYCFFES